MGTAHLMHRAFRWCVILVTLVVGCFACGTMAPPEPAPVPWAGVVWRAGWVAPNVKDILRADWTDKPGQLERAYCVLEWRLLRRPYYNLANILVGYDSIYVIDDIAPLPDSPAGVNRVTPIGCPIETPIIHVHPPQTCANYNDPSTCVAGGDEAYECFPSRPDFDYLWVSKAAFDIIQCGPDEVVFYFRTDHPMLKLANVPP